jgi:hypothetical protein
MIREEYRRAKKELKLGDKVYLQTKEGLEKNNCHIFQLHKDQIFLTDGSVFHYKDVYCMVHCDDESSVANEKSSELGEKGK